MRQSNVTIKINADQLKVMLDALAFYRLTICEAIAEGTYNLSGEMLTEFNQRNKEIIDNDTPLRDMYLKRFTQSKPEEIVEFRIFLEEIFERFYSAYKKHLESDN